MTRNMCSGRPVPFGFAQGRPFGTGFVDNAYPALQPQNAKTGRSGDTG